MWVGVNDRCGKGRRRLRRGFLGGGVGQRFWVKFVGQCVPIAKKRAIVWGEREYVAASNEGGTKGQKGWRALRVTQHHLHWERRSEYNSANKNNY